MCTPQPMLIPSVTNDQDDITWIMDVVLGGGEGARHFSIYCVEVLNRLMSGGGAATTAAILFISFLLFFGWKRKPFIRSLESKHVLVTGASSGIGLEIAKEALAQGSFVTLIARNLVKLEKSFEKLLEEVKCDPQMINIKVADISNYEAISVAINESFQWRPIDILVCNAGWGRSCYFDEMGIEDIDQTIGTNLNGTIYTLRVALPLMKQRSFAHPSSVVLMGSLASLFLVYGGGIYTATKHALRGIAESLKLELLPYNIRVSFICPGFVTTPLLEEVLESGNPELNDLAKEVNMIKREKVEDPKNVAKTTLEAAKEGRFLVTKGFLGFILSTLSRGITPADSFAKILFEMIVFVPARLVGFIVYAHMSTHIWWNYLKMRAAQNSPQMESTRHKFFI
eukprot:Gb_17836 [translate_table: standard]